MKNQFDLDLQVTKTQITSKKALVTSLAWQCTSLCDTYFNCSKKA
ncbi:hypothetical protein PAJ34TS1_09490 [Paenibacillus azoreducens]|uniref:Uncharacterized protein n=1 Tax=Paenibacillus azoreducens TaxID=116718 RepID=A0A920CU69_9BACL|nr:hypothetical protein J34TS1_47540 [Paenibacillus azoreducens]